MHTTLVQGVFKQHAGAEQRLPEPCAVERFGAEIEPPREQLRACLCNRLWQISQFRPQPDKTCEQGRDAVLAHNGILHRLRHALLERVRRG